ncbi:Heavy-metal-associated domain protein [Caloramator mitchellensis]|uniref:Heavy-metal-associated domain protein n=1 Tax=Caloramator mitchellensis TaxID=908809 RepID=A0A0R3JWQ7_CALMK|nr:heavy-metal-associated domain-containing protein [Caloramator mitchellensis]KRQ87971.1 Heavy-metal-associated domain protein [Caloramator mitchellensis]
MKELKIKVPSMHDEASAKKIASIIEGIRGIEDVNVDFQSGLVDVFYDENQVLDEKIKYVVSKNGYEVRNV